MKPLPGVSFPSWRLFTSVQHGSLELGDVIREDEIDPVEGGKREETFKGEKLSALCGDGKGTLKADEETGILESS